VGNLGVDINNNNGFDIGKGNVAYLMATVGSTTSLYTLNTTSGLIGSAAVFSTTVKGFAISMGF
jgi:hypothetical protein